MINPIDRKTAILLTLARLLHSKGYRASSLKKSEVETPVTPTNLDAASPPIIIEANSSGSYPVPRLTVEISHPNRNQWVKVQDCLVDSGSDTVALSTSRMTSLGLNLPILGGDKADTANGRVSNLVSKADVRVSCYPSQKTVIIRNLEISLAKDLDESLIGMNLLQYFSFHFIDGLVAVFELNQK